MGSKALHNVVFTGVATILAMPVFSASAASALTALTGGGPALTQGSKDVAITSFDGTKIEATVFTPNAPANTPVPLIIHANPWAGHRRKQLDPKGVIDKIIYTPSESAVKIANQNGYYVISYDQRGWGDSGGTDELMSPAYEGEDFKAVADWADSNLGPQLAKRSGKTVIGTLGVSYGGGFQTMAASLDDRVAVVVPSLAWHNLVYSLGPGLPTPQFKSAWGELLQLSGQFLGKKMNSTFIAGMKEGKKNGDAYRPLVNLVSPNGPNAYCDGGVDPNPGQTTPNIPTFLVQGWQDTLFNANEGIQNAQCFRTAGADVRLLIQQYGHMLPGKQKIPNGDGTIGIGVQATINCGAQTFQLDEAMYSFIDENIRGTAASGPHVNVPANCVTLDDSTGLVVGSIPVGGTSYSVSTQTVSGSASTWVPLYTATATRALAGIPHMRITITGSGTPYAYFGIGILRSGSRNAPELLDDQIFPIQGAGTYDTDMIGVAAQLSRGDQIGILASNNNSQYSYKTAASRNPSNYSFNGTFEMPFAN